MFRVLFSVIILTFSLQAQAEVECEPMLNPGQRLSLGNIDIKKASTEFGNVRALLRAKGVDFRIVNSEDDVNAQWIVLSPKTYVYWARLSLALLTHMERGATAGIPSLEFLDFHLSQQQPLDFMDLNSTDLEATMLKTVKYFSAAQLEGILLASLSDNMEITRGGQNRQRMSDQLSILMSAGFSRYDANKIVQKLQTISSNATDPYSIPTLKAFEENFTAWDETRIAEFKKAMLEPAKTVAPVNSTAYFNPSSFGFRGPHRPPSK